jgi:hypothetical protein
MEVNGWPVTLPSFLDIKVTTDMYKILKWYASK